MSVREITLSPAGGRGFAIFLERPQDKQATVYAFTEDYVKYILVRQNVAIAQQYGIGYQPPADGDPMKIVSWLHSVYLAQNWLNREPHMVELVDSFNDFKANETDMSKAVTEVKKRYNVMFGSLLEPPYPELVPAPRIPLPASPFL